MENKEKTELEKWREVYQSLEWQPVSNIKEEDKKEQARQEIIKAVEDHHKMYVDLWLSHLKGRGR